MTEYVQLHVKRTRGWPWPEETWGLDSMFGTSGWCRGCGVPTATQTGPLTLQRKGLKEVAGAWVPNWRFDTFCMTAPLAAEAGERFRLDLRDVAWVGTPPGDARQVVVPTIGQAWFDPSELAETIRRHRGKAGATCSDCGIWRWLPVPFQELPTPRIDADFDGVDLLASPEWFGDGWKSFREIIVRRELAELIVERSPRDFGIQCVRLVA